MLEHEEVHFVAKSMTKLAILEPVPAEALAELYATEFSRDLGLQSINIEGDMVQVVNAMKATL